MADSTISVTATEKGVIHERNGADFTTCSNGSQQTAEDLRLLLKKCGPRALPEHHRDGSNCPTLCVPWCLHVARWASGFAAVALLDAGPVLALAQEVSEKTPCNTLHARETPYSRRHQYEPFAGHRRRGASSDAVCHRPTSPSSWSSRTWARVRDRAAGCEYTLNTPIK